MYLGTAVVVLVFVSLKVDKGLVESIKKSDESHAD